MNGGTCGTCGASLLHKRSDARYCSTPCQMRAFHLANRGRRGEGLAAYREANRDAANAYAAGYREANRELIRAKARAKYASTKEDRAAKARAYREANPEKERARWERYQAHLRRAGGKIGARDWRRLVGRYYGLCAYCRVRQGTEVDHVIPLSRGGRNTIGNVLPACRSCNASKAGRLLVEWRNRPE